jgi:hypothetical protein
MNVTIELETGREQTFVHVKSLSVEDDSYYLTFDMPDGNKHEIVEGGTLLNVTG